MEKNISVSNERLSELIKSIDKIDLTERGKEKALRFIYKSPFG